MRHYVTQKTPANFNSNDIHLHLHGFLAVLEPYYFGAKSDVKLIIKIDEQARI
jgi:hypothetical protein